MKILKSLTLVFLSGLFAVSCVDSSDDVEVLVPNYSDFMGTWEMDSYSYTGYATYDNSGSIDTGATYVANSLNIDAEVEFTQNPNEIITSGTGDVDATLNFIPLGFSQDFNEDSVSFEGNGTWGASGDTININFSQFGTDINNSDAFLSSYTDSTATIQGFTEFSQDTLGYTLLHHIDYTINLVKE